MDRREFVKSGSMLWMGAASPVGRSAGTSGGADASEAAAFPAPPPLPFQGEKGNLRITGVRAVAPRPKRPLPSYTPSPGSWSVKEVEVANPMSIYPKYKPRRSLFMADDLGPEAVEITTDKGIKGLGFGGPGAGFVVEKHLKKVLIGGEPFHLGRLWDISSWSP